MSDPKCTMKELADILFEINQESKADGTDRTNWLLEVLERHEKDKKGGELFQRLRAELHRKGLRHSASETQP